MSLRARRDEARLAVMMLTRLPMGELAAPVPTLAAAAWAFPLVGLIVGGLGWAVLAGAQAAGLGLGLAALMAYGAMALVTGALHLDGLADFADGIGGGRDKARCLEIMRDSRIGSYGVLALIFAVGLGANALGQIAAPVALAALLLVGLASRFAMLLALIMLPPARDDGLGAMAAGDPRAVWLPGGVALVALALLAGPVALTALALMALAGGFVARIALRRIGGQTGDVLGAVQVVTEVAGLLAFAIWHAA